MKKAKERINGEKVMENKMEKRYGLPTAISMVIGIVIGSGVFIKGGKVLSLTGGNLLQGIAVVGIVGLAASMRKSTASLTTPSLRSAPSMPIM